MSPKFVTFCVGLWFAGTTIFERFYAIKQPGHEKDKFWIYCIVVSAIMFTVSLICAIQDWKQEKKQRNFDIALFNFLKELKKSNDQRTNTQS